MVGAPRLTNIFSRLEPGRDGEDESLLVIEATGPFPFRLAQPEPFLCQVQAEAAVNMYTGPLAVRDGIIREVLVEEPAAGKVNFKVMLETETEVFTTLEEGPPARVVLHFSREPLKKFYRGKRIVVDPGHGGGDGGFRGPVDLWEKDVVWTTSQEFSRALERLGAEVVITRGPEENPSWQERCGKVTADTALFISLHTHGTEDRRVRGAAVLYNPQAEGGAGLARLVLEEIMAKTKIPGRGVRPCPDLAVLGGKQGLLVETVTITNWVDEGILRNPYFHRKLALATIHSFFQFVKKGVS
ncbi:MAG: N-acetylmuramoyl-L-alanine amidase [Thermoanaerobacteraceae bacterium]|uniref:N-acetylmuramoyl-L-alanine amidase n=1 Tax=Thermanaeromonas sp. C210 TaxID=2731925 RepID=UPI00155B8270|nr:N-acetylmuramoyl-L-alanine amidase [Thermanaeromonas sp. C210]MBE3581843.1 N-acetylmuramoyl-L-alanine amidase [Thermoanaerobacteraceae bacterium]GFN22713.1 cell wall hydrolase/autolysin [Thermanaeromonas sp. C210]